MNQPIQNTELSTSQTVLLVDDNTENLRLLTTLLTQNGYIVRPTRNGLNALEYLEKEIPDLILLDIKMPKMDGYEVCRQLKNNEKTSQIPIIFISALNEIEDKVSAFSMGGVDYITKPFQEEEVLARVNTHITITRIQKQLEESYNAIEVKVKERTKELETLKKQLENENVYLQEEIKTTQNFGAIIGQNDELTKILKLTEQVAPSETTVLILGETGTGKELIARAIHDLSHRKNRPLVKVNCAALPSNLIESDLFGHEKGAFTGALSQKIGRFELANGGTIFLDEIGDLPLDLQAKLLRVLQEGEFERIGNAKTLKVDVRILAATNRNLDELRSKDKFRNDLFFRLNVFPIESPPLRNRKDDILTLISHFIERFNIKMGKKIEHVTQKNLDNFLTYHWPGNIRELENVIERAMILSSGNQLQHVDWLPKDSESITSSSKKTLDQMQKDYILSILEITQGKMSGDGGACEILGLKRTTLLARMKKLGITINKMRVSNIEQI